MRLSSVESEENVWSQSLFLGVEQPNTTLELLNSSLMTGFGMEPGFQAPCQKPHLSLLYGIFPKEIQKEACQIAKSNFGKQMLSKSYVMGQLELWKTGGGLNGVSEWRKICEISL